MMSRAGLVLVGLMALVLALFPEACIAKEEDHHCPPSSCGNIHNISYPFRLKGDPPKCGDRNYELSCENNLTILYQQPEGKFFVREIYYVNQTMRVVDASLDKDSCSIPRNFLTSDNSDCSDPYRWDSGAPSADVIVYMNCTIKLNSSLYVDVTPCINDSSSPKTNFYAFYGDLRASDVHEMCSIVDMIPTLFSNIRGLSIFDIHHVLLMGFDLSWASGFQSACQTKLLFKIRDYFLYSLCFPFIRWLIASYKIIGVFSLGKTSLGILCLIAFLIYKFRRRHLSVDDTIEEFLQSQNNFMPIRYSYSEIKKMTNGFKNKLGQGGYGSVYKGKLRSGHLVAIKVLSTSKANGKDFISEVATIGRIYHVNVVRLAGFCAEGPKRALVYDFMANGSLDKFIFSGGENINSLSWERTYQIGLGVARGIEYLHRGCDMQILHFDIKPHNILLDENFIPKISDFGLAKLYPIDDSIVSLTAARGTLGYIAPELFYKNIGGISYKADIYSFGMLLMEMVGKRKNVNAFAENSSQIYFPSWIYDRINQGEDIKLGDANEDEQQIARKMIIAALWCTQLKPIDRPSMRKILEMLEGEVESLQIPSKPLLNPQEMSVPDHADNNPVGAPIISYNDMGTITLDVR